MAKLRNKTFRRNSKRRISKKHTKKSKSRRRFRKLGGALPGDPSETTVSNYLTERSKKLKMLSSDDKTYVNDWGKRLNYLYIDQNATNQGKMLSAFYNDLTIEIIKNMKAKEQNIDDIALVIYGDQSPASIQNIQKVINTL